MNDFAFGVFPDLRKLTGLTYLYVEEGRGEGNGYREDGQKIDLLFLDP
jgi:hypothetical protein